MISKKIKIIGIGAIILLLIVVGYRMVKKNPQAVASLTGGTSSRPVAFASSPTKASIRFVPHSALMSVPIRRV